MEIRKFEMVETRLMSEKVPGEKIIKAVYYPQGRSYQWGIRLYFEQ